MKFCGKYLVLLLALISCIACSSTASAQYAAAPTVISTASSPASASSYVASSLDSAQQPRSAIIPMHVIQTPTYANIPDAATWAVIAQPYDTDSCAGTASTATMPSVQLSGTALCGTRVSGSWAVATFSTYAAAKSAYDGLGNVKPFALLVPTVASNAPWLVIYPGVSVFCN